MATEKLPTQEFLQEAEREVGRFDWEGSFADYLAMISENPGLARLSHKLVYDAILAKGVSSAPDTEAPPTTSSMIKCSASTTPLTASSNTSHLRPKARDPKADTPTAWPPRHRKVHHRRPHKARPGRLHPEPTKAPSTPSRIAPCRKTPCISYPADCAPGSCGSTASTSRATSAPGADTWSALDTGARFPTSASPGPSSPNRKPSASDTTSPPPTLRRHPARRQRGHLPARRRQA